VLVGHWSECKTVVDADLFVHPFITPEPAYTTEMKEVCIYIVKEPHLINPVPQMQL
jgi:hypothetical protein